MSLGIGRNSHNSFLCSFLSMLHNSTDVPGIAMHSESENWSKVERTAAVECGHPYTGNQVGLVLRVNDIYFVLVCIRCKEFTV